MKPRYLFFGLLCVAAILMQGCATNKALIKRELTNIPQLRVVRYATPEIKVKTFWRSVLGAFPGFMVLGPAGAGVAAAGADLTAKKVDKGVEIQDFGYLVMTKFVERIKTEWPSWPSMTMQEEPIIQRNDQEGLVLAFQVKGISLAYLGAFRGNGLVCLTIASLKQAKGDVLWQKEYFYNSSDFKRGRDMDEFMADGGKLLREEIEFAAEQTIVDFIKHIKENS
jgi:hypothetical protein